MATPFEEYLRRSEYEKVEFIDGEIIADPPYDPGHSQAQSAITAMLKGPFQYGQGGPGGWWIFTEQTFKLGAQSVQPDVSGWKKERLPIPRNPIEIPPDWVCEIISDSNARNDLVRKRALYAEYHIPYYWIVNPLPGARALDVQVLEPDGKWKIFGSYTEKDKVRMPPFEAIELDLSNLFLPLY